MNIKINTICFILLLFLLIGVVSATDSGNETLQQIIDEPDEDIHQANIEKENIVKSSSENQEKLELSANSTVKLESTKTSKKVVATITPANVKTKISIKAPNVKMHYNDGSKFTVTLKDSSKKVLKKVKVKITLNGKTYSKTTDSKGKASVNLKLDKGSYTVVTMFEGSKKYYAQIVKSSVTVKSTIKSNGLTKYYKNKSALYTTYYDKKGKLLKNTAVKIKLNGKTYSMKTNNKGVSKLEVNLKPGNYIASMNNPKTSEKASCIVMIKSILETNDLTMTENDGSKFSVKVLNSYGKVSPNKKVTLKVNGKIYTPKSNSNGIATQIIDLPAGKYSITTEYEGLIHTNKITVNKGITHTQFTHTTSIPNYVNVTTPYVFQNSAYALKTGFDGIIRMSKNEVYTIQISETKGYLFTQSAIPGIDSTVIGYKTHLIPFDGSGIISDYNKANLKGDGILISTNVNYTTIEYRSTTDENTELFGVYLDKGLDHSETITYIQNNKIKAKINFYTNNYDETGLKYNLAKFYGKSIYDFNYKSYDEITGNNANSIKFANTGESVTFNYFGRAIVGVPSQEEIKTKFIVNGVEELEKGETISYGLGEKYRQTIGFEVLQSYSIINEKVTRKTVEKWISKNSAYLNKFGIMNIYGMFLANLETCWIADELADNYANEFNVKWNRENPATILGGINLKDTYLHILNADMGMNVIGDSQNAKIFRLMNSVYLPNIENYVLTPVADRYLNNTINSLDNILSSIENNNFSIVQTGEIFYMIGQGNENSTIIINSTSGIANVILIEDGFAYKGSVVSTSCDCCSVGTTPKDIINGIKNTFNLFNKQGTDILNNIINKQHPLSILGYMLGNLGAGIAGKLMTAGTTLTLASTVGLIMGIHTTGNYIKNNFVDQKDWHWAYEHITFTRDGYMQNKKFYNIPKSDGTYDYVEVGINSDGSLNRNDVLYITQGNTKKLTEKESYKYFTEETWTPYNIPQKYQKFKIN